jgi:hypothetical protein
MFTEADLINVNTLARVHKVNAIIAENHIEGGGLIRVANGKKDIVVDETVEAVFRGVERGVSNELLTEHADVVAMVHEL